MKKGIIYEWRNKINGKFYVGQTIHPKARYNAHVNAQVDTLFHRAIKKHGIENFEYSVVATYEHETEKGLYDLLNEAEVERIKFRNSLAPNGYNVADGGKNSNPVAGFSKEKREEWIRKNSKAHLGKNPFVSVSKEKREEWGRKISKANSGENNGMYGKTHSDEACAKISKANKGKCAGDKNPSKRPDVADKISKAQKQSYIENPERRTVLSKKLSGKNNGMYGRTGDKNPMFGIHRTGENSTFFGKHHSDETKQIMSIKAKERFKNKENHPMFGKKGKNNPIYGKHWYNNGVDEHRYFYGEEPEGWVRGRLSKKNEA